MQQYRSKCTPSRHESLGDYVPICQYILGLLGAWPYSTNNRNRSEVLENSMSSLQIHSREKTIPDIFRKQKALVSMLVPQIRCISLPLGIPETIQVVRSLFRYPPDPQDVAALNLQIDANSQKKKTWHAT